jgi:hypothetical protein
MMNELESQYFYSNKKNHIYMACGDAIFLRLVAHAIYNFVNSTTTTFYFIFSIIHIRKRTKSIFFLSFFTKVEDN